jgi:Family of unknown function (DUF5681)
VVERFVDAHRKDELMIGPEKTGRKQDGRFRKGKSGNPVGRPVGSRNKTTLAMQELLDGEAETIVGKAIEKAKEGDSIALRLCLERIVAPRKDRPIAFTLPLIESAADALRATGALVGAVASGDVTPSEAADLAKLVDGYVKSLEAMELSERVSKLEMMIANEPAAK